MTYEVTVHYNGIYTVTVEADDIEAAKELAADMDADFIVSELKYLEAIPVAIKDGNDTVWEA